jgi:hypothetical protein
MAMLPLEARQPFIQSFGEELKAEIEGSIASPVSVRCLDQVLGVHLLTYVSSNS